jgi:hypothetical protein
MENRQVIEWDKDDIDVLKKALAARSPAMLPPITTALSVRRDDIPTPPRLGRRLVKV